ARWHLPPTPQGCPEVRAIRVSHPRRPAGPARSWPPSQQAARPATAPRLAPIAERTFERHTTSRLPPYKFAGIVVNGDLISRDSPLQSGRKDGYAVMHFELPECCARMLHNILKIRTILSRSR